MDAIRDINWPVIDVCERCIRLLNEQLSESKQIGVDLEGTRRKLDMDNKRYCEAWNSNPPDIDDITKCKNEHERTLQTLVDKIESVKKAIPSILEPHSSLVLSTELNATHLNEIRTHCKEIYQIFRPQYEKGSKLFKEVIELKKTLETNIQDNFNRLSHINGHPLKKMGQLIEHARNGSNPSTPLNLLTDKLNRYVPSISIFGYSEDASTALGNGGAAADGSNSE